MWPFKHNAPIVLMIDSQAKAAELMQITIELHEFKKYMGQML